MEETIGSVAGVTLPREGLRMANTVPGLADRETFRELIVFELALALELVFVLVLLLAVLEEVGSEEEEDEEEEGVDAGNASLFFSRVSVLSVDSVGFLSFVFGMVSLNSMPTSSIGRV